MLWIYALTYTFPPSVTDSFAEAVQGSTSKMLFWFKLNKKQTDVMQEAVVQNAPNNNPAIDINNDIHIDMNNNRNVVANSNANKNEIIEYKFDHNSENLDH